MNNSQLLKGSKKERELKELAFLTILYLCITVAIVTLMTLIYDVISTGYSRLLSDYELGLINKVTIDNPKDFLTSLDSRDPLKAGIGPAFAGTIWLMVIVIAATFPLGAGAAIYLQEFAPRNKLTRFIELNLTNLAGVPSVIYGLMGLAVFVRLAGFGRLLTHIFTCHSAPHQPGTVGLRVSISYRIKKTFPCNGVQGHT